MRGADGSQAGALVTGAARGIGHAIAEALASRGDAVTIADIDGAQAQEACSKLAARGLAVRAAQLDVTDVAQVHEVMREADRATPLTTVVCNAGLGFAGAIVDTAPEEFDRVMGVNVRGVFFTMQAALQVMTPRGRGNIVSISSTSGFQSSSVPMAVYDISKAAVRMLTMSAGRESAAAGIRVNAVAPGTVGTDLVKEVLSAGGDRAAQPRAHPARPARDAPGDRRGGRVPLVRRGVVHHRPHARRRRRMADLNRATNARQRLRQGAP